MRAVIFGCADTTLSGREAAFFREADPMGFILFARNVADPQRLRHLTTALRDAVGRDAPILIDQEGGRVQRMGPPHWRGWLPALDQVAGAGREAAARSMFIRYRLIAEELRQVGIDVDCAPLGDVARHDTHPILRNRCYGEEADRVSRIARAVAEGLMAGGVLPVLKHMPGHGAATIDSHLDLPVVSADRAALEAKDFAVFRTLADLPLGMTAHIVFSAIDPDRPATQSPAVIATIREEIGFDGLLMTDDISMQALGGDIATRGAAALAAGCDLVLHCNGDMDEMTDLAGAAGALADEGAERARRALSARPAAEPADLDALAAEFDEILDQLHA